MSKNKNWVIQIPEIAVIEMCQDGDDNAIGTAVVMYNDTNGKEREWAFPVCFN